LRDKIRQRLVSLVEHGALSTRERAEAGDVLGRLGDARFDPQHYHLPRRYRGKTEARWGFVEVPPGPFAMGSRKGDEGAMDSELGNPPTLTIPYVYWVARYPVTVAQYAAFVADGGEAPDGWQAQQAYPNRPVVGATWRQANAYCAWLDRRLREDKRRSRQRQPDIEIARRCLRKIEQQWRMRCKRSTTSLPPTATSSPTVG
jgi:hypothetical protein